MRKNRICIGIILLTATLTVYSVTKYYQDTLNLVNAREEKAKTQIEDLRKENKSLQKQCAQLNNTNVKLQSRINVMTSQINTMTSQIRTMKKSGCWFVQKGIATAYSPNDNRSGIEAEGAGHITSVGLTPGHGIIAVDPKRIPYGSKMKVLFSDGTSYTGIAGDTGGALRSDNINHIDIYKDTYVETEKFGIKVVTILWQPK